MKLIIDIPNDLYEKISKSTENWAARYVEGWDITVARIIRNGTPYEERPQGDLADEVWKLYEKHHSHLATHVIEFGDELKDLLSKYQKGGKEE